MHRNHANLCPADWTTEFGPIVPLLKWKDEEDVIARASEYLQIVWSFRSGGAREPSVRVLTITAYR